MSETPITFDEISVRRAPGFAPPGFGLEALSPEINIVFGPNASGKTTLARAIQSLLWPESDALEDADLTGIFHTGDQRWRIDYDRGRATTHGDGSAPPPELPRPDVRDRYYLGLQELLKTRGEDFAELIATESAGGYDIRDAGESLEYSVGALRERKITRQFRTAKKEWQQAQESQQKLQKRATGLDDLDQRLQQARTASRRARAVDLAIDFQEADRRRRSLEARLDEYPTALQRVSGDEGETLDRLRSRLKDAESDIAEARRTIEECERRLSKSRLPDDGPDPELLTRLEEYVAKLDDLRDDEESVEQQHEDAIERRDRLYSRISTPESADEYPTDVDTRDIEQLTELGDQFTDVDGMLRAYEMLESLLEVSETDLGDLDDLESGLELLRRWLAVAGTKPAEETSVTTRLVALGSAVAVAVVAILLAVSVHLAGLLMLIIALLLGWLAWRLHTRTKPGDEASSRRNHYRKDFRRLDLDDPEDWTEEGVQTRLRQLVDRWADATVERRKADLWEARAPEQNEQRERRRQLVRRRRALAEKLDLDLSDSPAKTGWLLSNLADWQRAADEAAGLRRRLETIDDQRQRLLSRLDELFSSAGFDGVDTAVDATARLDLVRKEIQKFESTRTRLQGARDDKTAAEKRRDRIRRDIDELFDRLDVEHDRDESIHRLCRQKPAYEELRDETIGARRTARDRRQNLRRHSEFSEELFETDLAELQQRREELRQKASKKEDLLTRREQLKAEIRAAKDSHECRRKQAVYQRRREELRRRRRTAYRRAVGETLVDYVADRTRDLSRPEVFHRARNLFGDITRGRYRLDLRETDEGPVFRAFDTGKSKPFGLDELSSGTRVQLLLAVRLAFVEQQERGPALPLVLDETLANSDDDRARAIIRAVERIGARGRQIFYFTAQRDEVRKWKALVDDDVDSRFVELDERARIDSTDETFVTDTALPEMESPPPPDETSHREYGELLGIEPPLSPERPVTAVHLWYLVDDVETLHRLVDSGLTHWGQLSELARRQGLDAVGLNQNEFDDIRALATALKAFLEAYSIGRGRPVDRRALEESGAVSETFIDRVSRLCRDVDGDARRLVDGLDDGEVKRFRTSNTRQLEDYLVDEGYLDKRDPLTPHEIWIRVLAAGDDDISPRTLRNLLERVTRRRWDTDEPERAGDDDQN